MNKVPRPIPKLGLYPYYCAIDDIAGNVKLNAFAKTSLSLDMAGAIRRGELTVRNPETCAPVPVASSMQNPSSYVTVRDLNAWLEQKGFTYKWTPEESNSVELDDSTQTAPATKISHDKGIPKRDIMAAFQDLYWDYDHWGKNLATPPDWLKKCRVAKGSKKTSALWNPVLIAVELLDKKIPTNKLNAVFVGLKDWTDEWQEASALLR